MAESKEELKNLLMKVKKESEKAGLKLNIQKTKVMASSPITSWKIDEKQWKQWQTLFLGSSITADGDCRYEIKRCLLLGRKAVTNLDSILKSRDITLLTKVHKVKSMRELTHWKRPWCWERLKVEEEGDDREWDGWIASMTQWTWVWVDSGSWWWIGRPGVVQSMGSQRVRHDWETELNWIFSSYRYIWI